MSLRFRMARPATLSLDDWEFLCDEVDRYNARLRGDLSSTPATLLHIEANGLHVQATADRTWVLATDDRMIELSTDELRSLVGLLQHSSVHQALHTSP